MLIFDTFPPEAGKVRLTQETRELLGDRTRLEVDSRTLLSQQIGGLLFHNLEYANRIGVIMTIAEDLAIQLGADNVDTTKAFLHNVLNGVFEARELEEEKV